MNCRLVPLGTMIVAASIVAASASAQSAPTVMPDGSILIDGVYYYPNGTSGPVGSGPIVPQPTCTPGQPGCVSISTGIGNDTVDPSSGNSTVNGGGPSEVINGQTGGAVSDVPEPGSWGMMLLGFACIGGALRRRRTLAPARST